ncbi:MAG TPA: hypothetical protein DCO86_00455 [Spirochaetaceae bacterium]|nr:hypothetical protein [Spirochaetaceae bacterium]
MGKYRNLITFFVFAVLFMLPFAGFAAIFDGYQKLDSIETEHFRICFPPENIEFARRTEVNCEKALASINDLLGTDWEPSGFPIVITDDIGRLNAYYTSNTSDHITLYNTVSEEGDLSCFEDIEYSILIHELTHALTLSVKSPAMDFFSLIIGDVFNNSFFMNFGLTEGYAVMVESLSGGGRANDVFAMNSILQGIKKREILSFRRTSGALGRERTPSKTGYVFTGAFFKHIYEKYGKEKMAEFTAGLSSSLSIKSLFRNVYGIYMDTAYDNFITSFVFPEEVPSDKLIAEDSTYANLFDSGEALFFADTVAKEIYKYGDAGVEGVISFRDLVKFAFSSDGSFFGMIEYENDKPALRIYDVVRGRIRFSNRIADVHDFAFSMFDGETCLALYRYDGIRKTIEFSDINGNVFAKHCIGRGEDVYSLAQCSDGKVAYLSKKGIETNVCIYDFSARKLYEFDDSESVVKRGLSYDSLHDRFIFSYARKGVDPSSVHYPRLGVLLPDGSGGYAYKLANEDLEGGVISPKIVGENLVFISDGYAQDSIRFAPVSSMTFFEYPSQLGEVGMTSEEIADNAVSPNDATPHLMWCTFGKDHAPSPAPSGRVPFRHHPFVRSLPFASKGLLLPDFGRLEAPDFAIGNERPSSDSYGLLVQNKEFTDQFHSSFSAHYVVPRKGKVGKHHIDIDYTHAFESKSLLMSLTLKPILKFDDSVTQTRTHFDFSTAFSVAWTKCFATNRAFQISGNVGYDLPLYESNVYVRDSLGFNLNLAYTDLIQKGYGFRNTLGFKASLRTNVSDVNTHFKNSSFLFFPSAQLTLSFDLPKLIPVQNTRTLTYSLPVSLSLSVFYRYTPYQKNALTSDHNLEAKLSANMLLFSVDLSETFMDVPFVVRALALEFIPSATYLNYTENPLADPVAYDGFKFDFSFLTYARIAPTILGTYFTSFFFDIGVRYSICQENVGDSFKGVPLFYLAVNGSGLFGGAFGSGI